MSCQTHLEGNVFFSGPRAGMNFNDGFGGGNNVESNLLFNFVRGITINTQMELILNCNKKY